MRLEDLKSGGMPEKKVTTEEKPLSVSGTFQCHSCGIDVYVGNMYQDGSLTWYCESCGFVSKAKVPM